MKNNNQSIVQKALNFPFYFFKDKLGKNATLSNRALSLAIFMFYILSPIDVIPDFFPLIGQVDDVYVFASLIAGVASSYLEKNKNSQY